MSTSRNTWKQAERRIATFFNTTRTPLSGGSSGHTRSDTLHKKLFVEAKLRVKHAAVTLWRETAELAKKEGKTPVVCLNEKGKEGFWILVHSSDLVTVADQVRSPSEITSRDLQKTNEQLAKTSAVATQVLDTQVPWPPGVPNYGDRP